MTAPPPLDQRFPQAREFSLSGGQTAVLMIHGFTASPAQMRPLARALHEKGYSLRGMRLPGHGTRLSDMAATGWTDWLGAVRKATLSLASRYAKVITLGLSMGGLLALMMGEEGLADGVIALAPAIKVTNRLAPLSYLLAPFAGRNLDQRERPTAADDIGYGYTPMAKVPDLLALARKARLNLPRLRCPLLLAQGRLDQSVAARGPEIILSQSVNCHDKQLLWLPHSPHVCTYGPDMELLLQGITDFLARIEAMDAIA
jgi:carboxylesterase